jgi:hypothetical protein
MPVAQQGSRAGLITTIVILAVVALVAIVMAFYFSAEKKRVEATQVSLQAKYRDYISETALQSGELNALNEYARKIGLGDAKGWDVLTAQRAQLAKSITGKEDGDASAASQAASDALAEAAKKLTPAGVTLPSSTDNLIGSVALLADKIISLQRALGERDAQVAEAGKIVKDQDDAHKAALEAKDVEVAKVRAQAEKAIADAAADRKAKQQQIEQLEAEREAERKVGNDNLGKRDVDIAGAKEEARQLKDRLAAAQARFDKLRVGVTEPMMRHGDGKIIGFSQKDYVTINLGRGAQIIPGMTFEVYDKNKGIPKLPQAPTADETPAGKASIEVVAVSDTSSHARIVKLASGQQIVEGDILMNVVYDPHVKYNFYVYGKFDLDRNGIATAQETDIVRNLIAQWGGRTMAQLSVDTDFIVLGIQPVVPDFSPEELAQPENVKKKSDAERDLDQYKDIVDKAREMHIPVLNQNRFLYFTGFYDLVKR